MLLNRQICAVPFNNLLLTKENWLSGLFVLSTPPYFSSWIICLCTFDFRRKKKFSFDDVIHSETSSKIFWTYSWCINSFINKILSNWIWTALREGMIIGCFHPPIVVPSFICQQKNYFDRICKSWMLWKGECFWLFSPFHTRSIPSFICQHQNLLKGNLDWFCERGELRNGLHPFNFLQEAGQSRPVLGETRNCWIYHLELRKRKKHSIALFSKTD